MSNRLPVEVNPFRLIEQRRQLSGKMAASTLPRLQALWAQEAGDFSVELEFMRSPSELPMISGQVCGRVTLECQRCLEAVEIEVDTQLNVVVTASQTDRRPEDEGYEICIVEDERLFLQDFIEDEILLALPVVPKHDSCQPVKTLCETLPDTEITTDAGNEYQQEEEKENPFAALKDWKKTE